MSYQIVSGDIFKANVDFIVQQTYCTAIPAKGLCKVISEKYPHIKPYARRKRLKYNWATQDTRSAQEQLSISQPPNRHSKVLSVYMLSIPMENPVRIKTRSR
jgi:hypothetical protein